MKLSKSDRENFSKCPIGEWFTIMDVWPRIKRGRYSLDRLQYHGLIERQFDTDDGGPAYFRHSNQTLPL